MQPAAQKIRAYAGRCLAGTGGGNQGRHIGDGPHDKLTGYVAGSPGGTVAHASWEALATLLSGEAAPALRNTKPLMRRRDPSHTFCRAGLVAKSQQANQPPETASNSVHREWAT